MVFLLLNEALDSLWKYLWEFPLLHWDMLEAYVAGLSFAFWIILFRSFDRMIFMKKYKFSSQVADFSSLDLSSWNPLLIYLVSIHIYHLFITKPPAQSESPTVDRIIFEVATGIILYDFIFFWIHFAMHYFTSFSRYHQHSVHHRHTVLCASVVQQHSAVDGTLQVVVNIIVQNTSIFYPRKHLLSRLLHNILITYMLTEIHAGYDGFWSMHKLFPGLVGGAACHEIHHRTGSHNFQQFFSYLDRMMGSYHPPLFQHSVQQKD
jgi:sterol desaturase/sphingolipid hydroxylase (fatty acid hydroxylase superfamily)